MMNTARLPTKCEERAQISRIVDGRLLTSFRFSSSFVLRLLLFLFLFDFLVMSTPSSPNRASKQKATGWLSSIIQNVRAKSSTKDQPSDSSAFSPRTYRRILASLSALKKSTCNLAAPREKSPDLATDAQRETVLLLPQVAETCVCAPDKIYARSFEILSQRRAERGRSGQRNIKSDSDVYDEARAKSVLEVLRSSLSAEEKLHAIKRSRDYWEGLGSKKDRDIVENQSEACFDIMQRNVAQNVDGATCISDRPHEEAKTVEFTSTIIVQEHAAGKEEPAFSHSDVEKNSLRRALTLRIDLEQSNSATATQPPPRSPVTVQEWVNSIDLTGDNEKADEGQVTERTLVHDSTHQEDNLHLGAEARNLTAVHKDSDKKRKSTLTLSAFRSKQSSFNSEASTFSTVSSLSSVESLLEARREDPEEILLALGFGAPKQEPMARIPRRFLSQPSTARGVDLDSFLIHQEEAMLQQDSSFHGYLGLAAQFPSDNRQPSAITNKILEALGSKRHKLPTGSMGVSHKVAQAADAFASAKLRRRSDSILDPANRDFLLRQGSEESSAKPKVLVLGRHTFSLDQEGGLVPSKNSRWESVFQKMADVTAVSEEDARHRSDSNPEVWRPLLRRQSNISGNHSSPSSSLVEEQQTVEKKDSFELEEMSFGDCTDASNSLSMQSIPAASHSDSSGFVEEGHQYLWQTPRVRVSVEESDQQSANTSKGEEEIAAEGLFPGLPASALSRHSSTTTITEGNQNCLLRKSSYPQPTPRSWHMATDVVPRHLFWSLSAEGLNAISHLPESKPSDSRCKELREFACQTDLLCRCRSQGGLADGDSEQAALELQSLRLALEHYKFVLTSSQQRPFFAVPCKEREEVEEIRSLVWREVAQMESLISQLPSVRFPEAARQMTRLLQEQSALLRQTPSDDGCLLRVTCRELENLKRELLASQERIIRQTLENAKEEMLEEMRKMLCSEEKAPR